MLDRFKYKIALPAPSLYGQFNRLDDIDYALTGLKALGFDDVFEVSRAAEIISDATRQLLADGKLKKPVISSACPAVVRLIRVRFPDLCGNVLPLLSPMELAATLAREQAIKRRYRGYRRFISPCRPRLPMSGAYGIERSNVDGVLSSATSTRNCWRTNKIREAESPVPAL